MPQFLFALFLTMATDNANINLPQAQHNWIHGRWLHVAVSSGTESRQPPPCDRHLILFRPDGEVRRYSPRKGWDRIRMDFNATENTVQLSPHARDRVSLEAERTAEGFLKVHMPGHGVFYYQKLAPDTRLDQIDFHRPPSQTPLLTARAGEHP